MAIIQTRETPDLTNSDLQSILNVLYEKHGENLIQDHLKLRSLLSDYAGKYKREINILATIVQQGMIEKLRNEILGSSIDTGIARLAIALNNDTGISEEYAYWGIKFWANVLHLNKIDNNINQISENKKVKDNKIIPQTKKTINGMSLSGFIIGISGMFFFIVGILPIVAIILSSIGLHQNRNHKYNNNWMANVGLILGIIYTLLFFAKYVFKII